MTRHATGAELVARTRRHNFFSWSAQDAINPIPFVRAEGVYFWDADGKRYFDLNSQSMCVNIGHGDPRVVEAIQAQAATLTYAGPGMATPIRRNWVRRWRPSPRRGSNKLSFTLGGSERQRKCGEAGVLVVTGRHKILTRYRAYHGASYGVVTLTGHHRRWASEPGLPGVVRMFDPYKYRSPLYRPGDSDAEFAGRCLDQGGRRSYNTRGRTR